MSTALPATRGTPGAAGADEREAVTVCAAFARMVAAAPRAPALRWVRGAPGGACEEWEYEHVAAAAARGACWLARAVGASGERACGRPPLVGVAVPEGAALPLVMMSVLLAGCAPVPLDARGDPPPRLAAMLARAAPAACVAADAWTRRALLDACALVGAGRDPSAVHTQRCEPAVVTADELFACPQGVACLDDEEPFASEGMPALTPRAAEALAARVNARAHAGPQAGSLVASRVASLAATNVFPQAVSHVYFTSGSSGAPKACVGTHACLARYAVGKNATFGLSAVDCAFVASAHTFDPSLGDIAAAFACGASVALAPRALVLGGQGALLSALREARATTLLCTPTLLRLLPEGTARALSTELPDLRVVGLGGECMPKALAAEWAAAGETAKDLTLLNCYGLTECTVYQACAVVRGAAFARALGPGLRRSHTELRVVSGDGSDIDSGRLVCAQDEHSVVGDGELGEVWIVGGLVGEGYLDLSAETALRFSVGPDGRRRFRTGDVACNSPGCGWALVGRKDAQVKVRGRRVELGDVENALLGNAAICQGRPHDGVESHGAAAAHSNADASTDANPRARLVGELISAAVCTLSEGVLVAVGVLREGCGVRPSIEEGAEGSENEHRGPDELDPDGDVERRRVAAETLRRLCADVLPAHMVPARIEFVRSHTSIPTTQSGKVSRGALSKLVAQASSAQPSAPSGGSSRPRGRMERLVARAFEAELGVRARGRHVSLLALGGDSLAALRVCQRLEPELCALQGEGAHIAACARDSEEAEDRVGAPVSEGGAFGELMGALGPAELLRRPSVRDFARHLTAHFKPARDCSTQEGEGEPAEECASGSDSDQGGTEDGGVEVAGVADFGESRDLELLCEACLAGCAWAVRALCIAGFVGAHAHAKTHRDTAESARADPLVCAASRGRVQCVRVLIALAPTPGVRTGVLHAASRGGCIACVDALVEHLGAKALAATDRDGASCVCVAARAGHARVLKRLLALCAEGDKALARAEKARGARVVDWRDRWGRTALMWAACNGHGGCVHALLDVCASESLVDAAGESAVAIAERRAQCGASAGRASVWAAIAAALGGAGTTKRGREMRARA